MAEQSVTSCGEQITTGYKEGCPSMGHPSFVNQNNKLKFQINQNRTNTEQFVSCG